MTTWTNRTQHYVRCSLILVVICLICLAAGLKLQVAQAITNRKTLWAAWINAKSPEDHIRLAAYYQAKAERLRAKQKHEEELAEYYLKHAMSYSKKYPTPYQNASHLAEYYRLAAEDAQATADGNTKVAQEIALEARIQSQE
jgi:hypothetical protein